MNRENPGPSPTATMHGETWFGCPSSYWTPDEGFARLTWKLHGGKGWRVRFSGPRWDMSPRKVNATPRATNLGVLFPDSFAPTAEP